MKPVLDTLQDVDLSSHWRDLLAFLNAADPFFVGVILGLTTLLGLKMVSRYRSLKTWGLGIATATFVITVGQDWWTSGQFGSLPPHGTYWRGLFTAGLVLTPLWIVFPVLVFVYNHLRLAVLAFLLYVSYAWIVGILDTNDLLPVGVGGGIASAFALVSAWILQPVTDFLHGCFVAGPKQKLKRWRKKRFEGMSRKDITASSQKSKTSTGDVQLKSSVLPENDKTTEADQRRAKARLKAELCYNLYELAIGTVFPRSMFQEFITRHLGDHQDADRVEKNATELESIILQYVNVTPQTYPATIPIQSIDVNSLTQWFLAQKQRIDVEEFDMEMRKLKINALTRRYSQLASQLVGEQTTLPEAEVAVIQ